MPQGSLAFSEENTLRFAAQSDLLQSVGCNGEVSNALSGSGLTIDDLIYRNSRTAEWHGRTPPRLSSLEKIARGIPFVSLFTGAGGMDLGFEAVGFSHLAAVENNEMFCNTLRLNRPGWKVFGPPSHAGDISDFGKITDNLSAHVEMPFEGVFVGGPPCQPFSIAANQRFSKTGGNFKRVGFHHRKNGNHLFNFIGLIKAFRPVVFVIENVAGLRDIDKGQQLAAAVQELEKIGYLVAHADIHDAADYGVPQRRQRMFVVGARRSGAFVLPNKQAHIGSGSVLSDIPGATAINHETRNHKAGSVLRYSRLDYGQRDQLGRVDRLDPTKPSKTVIAGGTKGGGRSHLHPEIPRTLTVRECARLQTFPDGYEFTGPIARQFTQVGNAVPPVMAAAIATQVAKTYF